MIYNKIHTHSVTTSWIKESKSTIICWSLMSVNIFLTVWKLWETLIDMTLLQWHKSIHFCLLNPEFPNYFILFLVPQIHFSLFESYCLCTTFFATTVRVTTLTTLSFVLTISSLCFYLAYHLELMHIYLRFYVTYYWMTDLPKTICFK